MKLYSSKSQHISQYFDFVYKVARQSILIYLYMCTIILWVLSIVL